MKCHGNTITFKATDKELIDIIKANIISNGKEYTAMMNVIVKPITLESLTLSSSVDISTIYSNDKDRKRFKVFANYSDGTINDVTNDENLSTTFSPEEKFSINYLSESNEFELSAVNDYGGVCTFTLNYEDKNSPSEKKKVTKYVTVQRLRYVEMSIRCKQSDGTETNFPVSVNDDVTSLSCIIRARKENLPASTPTNKWDDVTHLTEIKWINEDNFLDIDNSRVPNKIKEITINKDQIKTDVFASLIFIYKDDHNYDNLFEIKNLMIKGNKYHTFNVDFSTSNDFSNPNVKFEGDVSKIYYNITPTEPLSSYDITPLSYSISSVIENGTSGEIILNESVIPTTNILKFTFNENGHETTTLTSFFINPIKLKSINVNGIPTEPLSAINYNNCALSTLSFEKIYSNGDVDNIDASNIELSLAAGRPQFVNQINHSSGIIKFNSPSNSKCETATFMAKYKEDDIEIVKFFTISVENIINGD